MYRGGNRSNRGRGGGRYGGRGDKRSDAVAVATKSDAEGAPILRPGKNGNYSVWIKQLGKAAGKFYGDLARIYRDDKYYVPSPLDVDGIDMDQPWQAEGLTVDAYLRRTTLVQESKSRTQHINDMITDRPKLYAYVEQHLSPASEEMIRARPNWAEMSERRDPLLQHLAIKATHIVENSGDPVVDAQEARDHFNRLRMHGGTVPEFHQDFEFAVDALKATGQDFYSDAMLASEFISKLDGRFEKLKVDIENGAITRPVTLAESFNRASRYKVTSSHEQRGYNQMTSFLASSSSFSRGRGDRGGRGGGRGRGRGGRETPGRGDNKKAADGGGKRKTGDITGVASSETDEKRAKWKCYYCKEAGHMISECPVLAKKDADKISGVTFYDADDGDDRYGFSLMSAVSFDELVASVHFWAN